MSNYHFTNTPPVVYYRFSRHTGPLMLPLGISIKGDWHSNRCKLNRWITGFGFRTAKYLISKLTSITQRQSKIKVQILKKIIILNFRRTFLHMEQTFSWIFIWNRCDTKRRKVWMTHVYIWFTSSLKHEGVICAGQYM